MYKYFALCLFVASALAIPAPESDAITQSLDCMQHDEDMLSCFAIKTVNSFNRAARSADLKIIDGITFVRDVPADRSGKSLKSEKEMLSELPRDAADKTLQLANMLFESVVSFFKSHSLKINVPEASMSRALTEDLGRGKIKKMILPLVAAAGVKIFALVPILLGGLALLVAKALFVGKIALLIAGILAFNRMFSGGSIGSIGSGFAGNIFGKNPQNTWSDYNQGGWSAAGTNQGQGYYRSFSEKSADVAAQQLAYSAQVPSAETNEAH